MLTDYHVHLRPDDIEAQAAEYHTAANAERYREAAAERGIEELGVSEHVYRFSAALELWRHPFWERYAHDDLDEYCDFVREQTDLRLGLEVDFVPGAEDRTASMLDACGLDYVVGSVHFIRDGAVDMDDFSVWGSGRSAKEIWTRYFETVAASARSGLFDIVAHPDLVKIWGPPTPPTPPTPPAPPDRPGGGRPLPEGDLRRYYEPTVEAIAEAGVAVEVSTAGLRKPAGEIYPAPAFLAMCAEAGVPVALSSDAHRPADIGAGYEQALELLAASGIGELAVFAGRNRTLVPIAAPAEAGSAE